MKTSDWEIWLFPLTPSVVEALRAWDAAQKAWRAVAPRMTGSRATVKLLAWASGATAPRGPDLTQEQKAALGEFYRAKVALDVAKANAVGPWYLASREATETAR
jgi:hypothetical protein